MKKQGIMILIIVCLVLLAGIGLYIKTTENTNEIKNEGNVVYSNFTIENVSMSYFHYGAYSPFSYIRVNITGFNATVSYQYLSSNATIINLTLSEKNVSDFIKKYQEMDFFNMTIDNHFVFDVGTTEISLRYNNMNRTISYISTEDKNVKELEVMYWNLYWPLIEPKI